MDAFRELVAADAKAKVEQIPAMVEAHMVLFRENFTMSQEEARSTLAGAAGDLKAGKSSAAMKMLLLKMNDALAQDIEVLRHTHTHARARAAVTPPVAAAGPGERGAVDRDECASRRGREQLRLRRAAARV